MFLSPINLETSYDSFSQTFHDNLLLQQQQRQRQRLPADLSPRALDEENKGKERSLSGNHNHDDANWPSVRHGPGPLGHVPFVRSSATILDPGLAGHPLPISRESSFATQARDAYHRGLDPAGWRRPRKNDADEGGDDGGVIRGSDVIKNGVFLVNRNEEEREAITREGRYEGAREKAEMWPERDESAIRQAREAGRGKAERRGGGNRDGGDGLSMRGKFITRNVNGGREEIKKEKPEKSPWDGEHGGRGNGGGGGRNEREEMVDAARKATVNDDKRKAVEQISMAGLAGNVGVSVGGGGGSRGVGGGSKSRRSGSELVGGELESQKRLLWFLKRMRNGLETKTVEVNQLLAEEEKEPGNDSLPPPPDIQTVGVAPDVGTAK